MKGLSLFHFSSIFIVGLATLRHSLRGCVHCDFGPCHLLGLMLPHFSSEARNFEMSDRTTSRETVTANEYLNSKVVAAFSTTKGPIAVFNRKQMLPHQAYFNQNPLVVNVLTRDNSSNDIDKISFCWCKLIFNGESIGSPTRLILGRAPRVLIDDIRKLMKEEFFPTLATFSAAELEVHVAKDYDSNTPLKASTTWNPSFHGGDKEENALIIQVSDPGMFTLHQFIINGL